MRNHTEYDGVVVGSGPNGLAAAITLAQKGLKVLLVEGEDTIGGGSRSAALTLPGFLHDTCSAVHPLAASSRFFQTLHLDQHGLEWIYPPVSLAHPLDHEPAVLAFPSLEKTIENIGNDGRAYRRVMQPLLNNWDRLHQDLMSVIRIPAHPFLLARFGLLALKSITGLSNHSFKEERAKALLGGMSAHSMLPLTSFASASFGLVLGLSTHAIGWPIARGGSQKIIDALQAVFLENGGEIITGWKVKTLSELPPAKAVLMDLSPRQILSIAGEELKGIYPKQLNGYRYGNGVFKVDWALDGPIPWKDRNVLQSATVHVGGTIQEIAQSEQAVWDGQHPENPYVLLAQPTLFDPSRAPSDSHTAWAYCHVPSGSTMDMRERIENQVERFAPGFRDRILGFHTINAAQYEQYNPNYVGGDINAGVQDFRQFLTRPVVRWNPYSTSKKGLYICSASSPPGGGVHGMCGYLAAVSALKQCFGIRDTQLSDAAL